MEKWKQIKGFANYEISTYGRLRRDGKILKTYKEPNGYERCNLYNNNKNYSRYVHRLAAQTYIPNEKEQVNHIDGNKHNNNLDNLEWVTVSQNTLHAYKNGLTIHRTWK